jgi:nucleotide-binding universal stress UspA family protein
MRMLCATDLSSRSDRAMRRAGILARATGSELVLLAVVDDDQPASLVASERQQVAALLAEQARTMQELQGLQPRLRVETGDAFDVIIKVADAENADLVVMGEHRKRLLLDVFIGTTIERVMRLGRRPVLMVNHPAQRPYRRVLAAVDMSEPSAHALRTARRLGFLRDADLTVFHAFEHPDRGKLALASVPAEAIAEEVGALAAERRSELSAFLRDIDLGEGSRLPQLVLEEGTPAFELFRATRRLSPDLVVVGTRGRGALGRLLLGSVAEEAMRMLDCDVLAVPRPAP